MLQVESYTAPQRKSHLISRSTRLGTYFVLPAAMDKLNRVQQKHRDRKGLWLQLLHLAVTWQLRQKKWTLEACKRCRLVPKHIAEMWLYCYRTEILGAP